MDVPRSSEGFRLLKPGLGRQMFALFMLCAFVPIAVLSLLAWSRVGEELAAQSQVRLHDSARHMATLLLDRLESVEAKIAAVEGDGAHLGAKDDLGEWLASLRIEMPDGRSLVGESGDTSTRGIALGSARGRLFVTHDGSQPEVWMHVPRPGNGGQWVARLDPDALFATAYKSVLPPGGEICIADRAGSMLWRSHAQLDCARPPPSTDDLARLETVQVGDELFVGIDARLDLGRNFHGAVWTIHVAEPEAFAMAPVATLRNLSLLVSGVALSLVALLSAWQIRRQLLPLDRLEAAATKVSDGEFHVSLPVETNDEFGRVSAAFNEMSSHLASQFASMERLIEMDRKILSAKGRAELVSASLEAVAEISRSPVVGIALPDLFDLESEFWQVARRDEAGTRSDVELPRVELDLAEWYDEARGLMIVPANDIDRELRGIMGIERDSVEVHALFAENQCFGIVYRIAADETVTGGPETLAVRQISNQIASALHGLSLRTQNEQLLRFDSLTGLPNLVSHEEDLANAVARSGGEPLSVVRVSITGMNRYTNTYGVARSEEVLRKLADALGSISGLDPARVDQASFGAIFLARDMDAIVARIRSISTRLRKVIDECGGAHRLGVVIGSALRGLDGGDARSLIHKADIASRQDPGVGVDSIAFFSEQMERTYKRSSQLEASLAQAIESDELRLEYQPIVDVNTRELVGAEALLRWTCPTRGPVSPAVFVEIAEESGLIQPLGDWVLRRAFKDVEAWRANGLQPVRISVNVSASQVNPSLCDQLASLLASHDVRPEDFAIELTESAVLDGHEASAAVIERVRQMGLTVSIDDFGTGYSSLGYLKRFPVDTLKIDRSFLQGVPDDDGDCGLTRAAIAVGRALGLRTIAEGCETEEQLAFLRDAECDLVQGFLFAKSMPPDQLAKHIELSNRGGRSGAEVGFGQEL